jgi:hypothetical protein
LVAHPRRHHCEPGASRLERDAVQPGVPGVLASALQPGGHEVVLDVEVGGRQQHRRLARLAQRQLRDHVQHAVELHDRRRVGDVGDDLQAAPQAGMPRERDRVEPEGEDLGDRAGGQQRHQQAAARRLAGARHGRGLRRRVVADQRHRPAQRARAAERAMADRVGGAVEAGALAEPEPGDAVVTAPGELAEELRAGDRRGGELLVDAGPEDDTGGLEVSARSPQLLIEAAERGPGIAADEHGGVVAAAPVESPLVEREPDQGLDARDQHPPRLGHVLVLERDLRPGDGGTHADGTEPPAPATPTRSSGCASATSPTSSR